MRCTVEIAEYVSEGLPLLVRRPPELCGALGGTKRAL
jgi:hypothetical protein